MSVEAVKATRAGIICFNWAGQVLLVNSKNKKDEWVFPKGHIESWELDSPWDTARREAKEEAGVDTNILDGDPLGQTQFQSDKELVVTDWYVGFARCCVARLPAEIAARSVRWASWEEAMTLLSFDSMKEMLRLALCHPTEETEEKE